MKLLPFLACLLAAPATALTPPFPCTDLTEANMVTTDVDVLGGYDAKSGVIVEAYRNKVVEQKGAYNSLPPPVPALESFSGTRVTHCASGRILAVRDVWSSDVRAALAATEFLRDKLKAGQKVSFGEVKAAVTAVYGKPIELRETAQTCGCNNYFDELRPKSQTPYGQRKDVGY